MSTIEKYILLIKQFVSRKITVSQFEVLYLEMFKNEVDILPEDIYDALNKLFSDVDLYCDDLSFRDDEDLSEEELLVSAKETLKRLV